MATPSGHSFSDSRVVVVGAGGLGCAVLPRIARLGVGELIIIDGDLVEEGNLDRQPLYELMDIGHFKASTAAGWMRQLMVGANVVAHDVFLDAGNATALLADADAVVEGVDDLHAKALIDRTCGELCIPLISGGVHRDQGQVIVLHAPGANASMGRAGLFSGPVGAGQDGCDMRNVPLSLLEDVGRCMVLRMRDILDHRTVVNGRMEIVDRAARQWMTIDPPR